MKLHPRLLREAKKHQTTFILSISLGLMGGILGILQAREISRLVSQVFLGGQGFEQVSKIFFVTFIIILLRVGAQWAGERSANAGAQRIKHNLRQRLYSHIAGLGPAFLRGEAGDPQTRTGELTNVAIEGIEALEAYFSQYLPQVALAALVPISILIFVFPTDWLSAVVLLITAPLLPLFMYLIGSAAETLTRKQWKGLSRMSAYFLDILQGLTTLKSLGRSREQVEVVRQVSEQYRQSTMEVLKVTFLSSLVLELIATLSTAVVAVEIGVRLLYGKIAFEQAFFVLMLAPEFYHPLRTLGMRFHAGMAGVEAARRIYEIFDLPVDKGSLGQGTIAPISQELSSAQESTPPSIIFKEVSFSYANERQALNNISCEIPAGKMTALVGESGAGKSTLTWLLLRFLQPQGGEILVNGRRLAEIPSQEWRQQLVWVPQNPYLFDDTIMVNIKLAHPEASDADARHAAQLAHADEFINHLPQGYSTRIGERGARLSAGQAQRIALARAFLKDAPLLILDEATSHLDPELDAELQESLHHLAQGRTVLVIAHHRSTLYLADQVIRLKSGMVEETLVNKTSLIPTPAVTRRSLGQAATHNSIEIDAPGFEPESEARTDGPASPIEMRLLKLLSPFTWRIILSIVLGFATIASGVGLMTTAAYIISAAALHPSIAELQVAIVGVRFFGLSRGVFRYLERLVSHDVTFRLLAGWRTWFYQALEPLAPARLIQYHSGDLLSRVIGDIGTLENFYVRAISPPLVAILIALTSGLLLGAFETQFGWVLVGFFVLAGLGVPFITYRLSHRLGPQIIQRRAELSRVLIDGIQGLPDLLTSGQTDAQFKLVSQIGDQLTKLQRRMAGVSAAHSALESLLASLAMLSILVLATNSVAQGKLDGVLLGVLALAALTSFEAMQPLPLAAQNYEMNRAASSRLYELVDAKPAVNDPIAPLVLPNTANLDVKHLSFQYPASVGNNFNAEQPQFALQDISFSLPQGKHIAIVGHSGAGKTTLINLLMRFWEYQSGSIQLDGYELRHFRQDEIRKRMAVISQNTYLFSATIKENLLIARPDATDQQVIGAVNAAQLHDLIQSLPDGYSTWVGEMGFRLSAGERQRLAVARALLMDAPVLILDEPTAHLDPVTELAVLDSIRVAGLGRSMINITQRMVGLDRMDEILVLKEGGIIERGTHRDLLSKKGSYSRMWEVYNQVI